MLCGESQNEKRRMRITQMRIYSTFLLMISIILELTSFLTVHWHEITIKSYGGVISPKNYGLFKYCYSDGKCFLYKDEKEWNLKFVISNMALAIIINIVTLTGFIFIFFVKINAKIASVGICLAVTFASLAMIVYPLKNEMPKHASIGYSYYFGWSGIVIGVAAGVFAFQEKNERIQPMFYDFTQEDTIAPLPLPTRE